MIRQIVKNINILPHLTLANWRSLSLLLQATNYDANMFLSANTNQSNPQGQSKINNTNIGDDYTRIKAAVETVLMTMYERHGEKVILLAEKNGYEGIKNCLRVAFPKDKPRYMSSVDISYLVNQLTNGDDDVLSCAMIKMVEIIEMGNEEELRTLRIRAPEIVKAVVALFGRIERVANSGSDDGMVQDGNGIFSTGSNAMVLEDQYDCKKMLERNFYDF
jgi:hypothetical protein